MSENKNTQLSMSERFTNKLVSIYEQAQKGFQLTETQKSLVAGYYIKCDEALKTAKIGWNEVNMNALALDLVNKSRLGLDMQMKNHLFPIPYKNNKTGKVTLNLITGFEGEKHKRLKFAEEKPVDMRVEIIYANDKFTPQKTGQGDTYALEITNPFDRGNIVGGIGYIQYDDSRKNVLIIMSEQEILKRKPPYAKTEFWGKWKEKMYEKTIMKELCNHITMDADKVKEYHSILDYEEKREVEIAKEQADVVIDDNANNGDVIDIIDTEPQDEPTVDIKPNIDDKAQAKESAIDVAARELEETPDILKGDVK